MMNSEINFFRNKKNIILLSVIIVLLILICTVIAFCYKTENKNTLNDNVNTTTANAINDNVFAGDCNILFVCNAEGVGDVAFAMLLEFQIYSESISISMIDMTTSDGIQTFAESYSYGGINSLINSIENIRKCSVSRYMIIDRSGVGRLTEILGKVNLYVTEGFTYTASDKSYEVAAGNNDMDSDMLYTYLAILSKKSDSLILAETLCDIINFYISGISAENSEKLFGDICNCVVTDITITDYFSSKNDFEYLLSHNPECYLENDDDI